MQLLTRREWITSTAGLFGAMSVSNSPAAESGLITDIVDAHVHIWTADTEKYPLAPGFTTQDLWYPSFSAEETIEHGRAAGVNRFNLIQMTWYGLDHSYIIDVIANDPEHFVGTGIIPAVTDVALPSPDRTMVALAEHGVYAFRLRGQSRVTRRWMDFPGYDRMFAAGTEHNLALSFLMGPSDLPEVSRMCTKYPDTPVILDHFAGVGARNRFVEEEIQALCRMAEHRRVMVKFGGFYARGRAEPPYLDMLPLMRRIVDAFGPERCMWESDAPKQVKDGHTFEAAVAIIRDHADFLSAADKHQILVKTAEDFFFKRHGTAN